MKEGRSSRSHLRTAAFLLAPLMSAFSPAAFCIGMDPAGVAEAAEPFSPGETLNYRVVWDPPWYLLFLPQMEAGELRLSFGEITKYKQKPAVSIRFEARSSGSLASLTGIKVEDTFESLVDPETLCTYTVSKRVREGKRKRDIDVTYFPETRRLHIRQADAGQVPPQTTKDRFVEDVPPCVHDVFAAVYALRRANLQVGSRDQWVLGDDDSIKKVETRVVRSEIIQGHAGPVRSLRIETVALLGGLFREGGQFRIWLSEDRRKLPVRFEISVKLGKAYGRLVSVKP